MTTKIEITGLDSAIQALAKSQVDKALTRALRRGTRAGTTAVTQGVRETLPLKLGQIREKVSTVLPRNGLDGLIAITSPSTPLSELRPRPLRRGFSVRVTRGERPVKFPIAFQQSRAGARLFQREGSARLPIKQLFTRSVTQVADDEKVLDNVAERFSETARAEFARQIGLLGDA